jgi:hypothetical protein
MITKLYAGIWEPVRVWLATKIKTSLKYELLAKLKGICHRHDGKWMDYTETAAELITK